MEGDFASYLRELRRQAGWTVGMTSKRTGISPSRWHDLERGEARATGRPTGPSRANCLRIAKAFGEPAAAVLARAGFLPTSAYSESSTEVVELVAIYRSLSAKRQRLALKLLRVMAD